MSEETTLTRRDLLLGMIQKEFPSYHPLISIARIAHHGDADLKTQLDCHKTIAKYVEPELKSIEVKGEINGRHRVSVSLFEPAGASFTPVLGDGANDPRVLEHEGSVRQLPGGGPAIDMADDVVDRVTVGQW